MSEFTKQLRPGAHPDSLAIEAAGLSWLAEAEPQGGTRIARVLAVSGNELVIERVVAAPASRERAAALGRSLARLHASGASWHACPPQGYTGRMRVGSSETPLAVEPVEGGWGATFAEVLIEPIVRRLVDRGDLSETDHAVIARVCDRLRDSEFDAPQPEGVPEVARIHGDLWAGNVLWSDVDTGAVLIDPHAQGGHAETDIAMLDLFGLDHFDVVVASYREVAPFADGWEERLGLQQLQPLLVHSWLFGGHYTSAAVNMARRYA